MSSHPDCCGDPGQVLLRSARKQGERAAEAVAVSVGALKVSFAVSTVRSVTLIWPGSSDRSAAGRNSLGGIFEGRSSPNRQSGRPSLSPRIVAAGYASARWWNLALGPLECKKRFGEGCSVDSWSDPRKGAKHGRQDPDETTRARCQVESIR
jgi:hypothetical protein